MKLAETTYNAQFVLSNGDNMYPCVAAIEILLAEPSHTMSCASCCQAGLAWMTPLTTKFQMPCSTTM